MRALVRAELLKLRTRTAAGLLLATLALVALTVGVNIPKPGAAHAGLRLGDPGLLAGSVGIGFGVPEVLVVLLGGLAFTQEFRYGTITSTYLGEPRRTRILAAKWLTLGLVSIGLTIVTLAVSVPLAVALIHSRHGDAALTTGLWRTVAAGFVVMAADGLIGVAVGALVRNQVVAIVCVLVWMLAVEQVVTPALPALGRWFPGGAADGFLGLGPAIGLRGELLPGPAAGLVLLGYAGLAVAAAQVMTPRRDV